MKIFAHRGASGEFPENTLLAFREAINQNADGIELDVFEVEGEFYIWHDRYLPESTGIQSPIWQLQQQQLAQLNLNTALNIPTLTEALNVIAGQCAVNIEIKQICDVERFAAVLERAMEENNFRLEQIIVSSFDHLLLKGFKRLAGKYRIGVLMASSPLTLKAIIEQLAPYSLHLDINCLRPEVVKMAHDYNLKCYVYTVDRETDIRLVKDMNVDGIFSNFPCRAKALIEQLK